MIIIIFTLVIVIVLISNQSKYDPKIKFVSYNFNYEPTNLMVVAHPDDELLWGYCHLLNNPSSWKVICLSNVTNKTRSKEFINVMTHLNIKNYEIWNNEDGVHLYKLNTQCKNDILSDIKKNKYTKVITHNNYGEYGNIQHIGINHALCDLQHKHNFVLEFFQPVKWKSMSTKNELLKTYSSQSFIIHLLHYIHPFYNVIIK
jgi:LmbE family N-acetylglucosaminyl deacetylase